MKKFSIRKNVFIPLCAIYLFVIILGVVTPDGFAAVENVISGFAAEWFGWAYQLVTIALVIISVWALFSKKAGSIRIGGENAKPTMSKWSWFVICLCSSIATGIVFWGIAEPITHYVNGIPGLCEGGNLSFYDAAAPIVTAESVDMSKAFFASRYDKGGDDYINCPMNKEEYTAFYHELINAESAPLHGFDKAPNVYEGCMPVEVLAKRGEDSIRFGPLKPVGLRDPRTGHRPWAAVQLRRENAAATLFNIVGFQTNLKFSEQKRVFSMIPGLENAEFMRYGVMHRNTFINSPKLLNRNLSLKADKNIFIAGQLSGVEGYMESAACGLLAARSILAALEGKTMTPPPADTMCGALIRYITSENKDFQPMGSNMGILPPLETHIRDKRERYAALADRAVADMKAWLEAQQ